MAKNKTSQEALEMALKSLWNEPLSPEIKEIGQKWAELERESNSEREPVYLRKSEKQK